MNKAVEKQAEDGKTDIIHFFSQQMPNMCPPASSLHGANTRYGYTRGWKISMRFICESFSSIGIIMYENI